MIQTFTYHFTIIYCLLKEDSQVYVVTLLSELSVRIMIQPN